MTKNEIVIMALEAEAPELAKRSNVYICGVGKINAAIMTAKLLAQNPEITKVYNFGTAGGITLKPGLHRMHNFVERDRAGCPASLELVIKPEANLISYGEGYTCSTGDDFVMDPNLEIPADVVDMEAYAIAKACDRAGVEFECWKYVSDGANADSAEDWVTNVSKGQYDYLRVLDAI
jgi:adenosylhomocysteine nucleosidase